MNKQSIKDTIGWGLILWLVGYVLGIILFVIVSPNVIGWIIMPVGMIITLWVLFKKIKAESLQYYFLLAVVWSVMAVIFDYIFIVKMLKPAGGYYKLDVCLYYVLTFILPLIVGWYKKQNLISSKSM